jgi:hypothetical protein
VLSLDLRDLRVVRQSSQEWQACLGNQEKHPLLELC